MRIGAHLSVSDGYAATVDYALEVGCECMQVFAKSPRMWRGRPTDPEAAGEFTALRARHDLGPLFTHTAYLINPAADDPLQRSKSVEALADELLRGRILGASGVVVHIGHDRTNDLTAAVDRVSSAIVEVFDLCGCAHPGTRLLLENTAGTGHAFGSSFREFGMVFRALPQDVRALVGICLDTCHAHAAGIDLRTTSGWSALLDEIESDCGAGALGLVHANDCKFELGSHKDRHEWIGDGFLGEEAFRAMLDEPRLADVCAVTEMPGEVPDKDIENIARLTALRASCG